MVSSQALGEIQQLHIAMAKVSCAECFLQSTHIGCTLLR